MMVSIIIPTYKRSERLCIAIDSVLAQTYTNIEIIVVDDNGDNTFRSDTREVLRQYIKKNKIKYICHDTNLGGCKARNTGAYAAKGEYLSFLDDDDFYEINKIEKQLKFIEKNNNLDACICSMYRVDQYKKQIESHENIARGETLKGAILDGNIFTSMLLIKKEVFIKLEGFSEIPRFQDKYFHLKFLQEGYNIGVLNDKLLTLVEHLDYRISSASTNKVVFSLNKIHEFIKNEKTLFTKREWRSIKLEYLYAKAFIRTQGNFTDRFKSIGNIFQALPFTSNYLALIKLSLRALLPNSLFKQ